MNNPKYIRVENPEYQQRYQIWQEKTAIYNDALAREQNGEKNHNEVYQAGIAMNAAKSNLDYTEQYILISV